MRQLHTLRLTVAGLLTAVGIILPMIFHSTGLPGQIFLPMHIPVLLTGIICGYWFGGVTGAIIPIVASMITGRPPLFPNAIYMAFELAAYGIIAGLLIKRFHVVIALVGAMIGGRIVLAIMQAFLVQSFALEAFLAGAFIVAWPGLLVQIILIPIIIITLEKVGLLPLDKMIR